MDPKEQLADRKKSLPALFCNLLFAGTLAIFFGVYWLSNPDSNVSEGGTTVIYYCWSSVDAGKLEQGDTPDT